MLFFGLVEEKQLEAELENYILGGQEGAWNPSHKNKLERSELEEELEANQRGRGHPIQQQQEQEQEIEFIQPKIFSPIYNTPELLRQGIEVGLPRCYGKRKGKNVVHNYGNCTLSRKHARNEMNGMQRLDQSGNLQS